MFLPLIFACIISDLVLVLLKKESKKRGKKSCSKKNIVLRELEKKGARSDSWYAQVLNFHISVTNLLCSLVQFLLGHSL